MSTSIKLQVQLQGDVELPSTVPVVSVRHQPWTRDRVAALADQLGVSSPAHDAGLWFVARDEHAVAEIYQATQSFRFARRDVDGEARDGTDGAPSAERATEVATTWMTPFWPGGAEPEVVSVTDREVLVAERGEREPRRLLAGADVNIRFGFHGVALLGPGAKAKVAVDRDGRVVEAYRFWRDLSVSGERRGRSFGEVIERFTASDLFAGLSGDRASATLTSARYGHLCLPPTEHVDALVPVVELRGILSTEQRARYEFVRYVGAADPPRARRDPKLSGTHPSLVIA